MELVQFSAFFLLFLFLVAPQFILLCFVVLVSCLFLGGKSVVGEWEVKKNGSCLFLI
jgi:hypothetical protein